MEELPLLNSPETSHAPWQPSTPLLTQERPEDVPTGELPRAVTLVADRHLVGRVAPGTRVTVTGIYSICQVCIVISSLALHKSDRCAGALPGEGVECVDQSGG